MNALARVTIYEPTTIELEAARRRRAFRASIAARAAALGDKPRAAAPAPAYAPVRLHYPPIYPPPHIPDTFYDPDIPQDSAPVVAIRDIQRAVCQHYELSSTDLLSRRRLGPLVRARQIAFYLCREMTTKSLPDIGRRFGGMDHTTVLHGARRIAELVLTDPNIAYDATVIMRKLGWRP